MVYRGTRASGAQWTESRTPVTGFQDNGLWGAITMGAEGFHGLGCLAPTFVQAPLNRDWARTF